MDNLGGYMGIIKKVLANVVQTLTRSEQTIAKKNIGLGDAVYQPPVDPYALVAGSLVWDPDHNGVYRLLEDWSYTRPWSDITKKVRVAPNQERDPCRIDLTISQIESNIPGIYEAVRCVLTFGIPYIVLDLEQTLENKRIFNFWGWSQSSVTSRSYVFEAIEPDSAGTKLTYMRLSITSQDNVNYSSWSVAVQQ